MPTPYSGRQIGHICNRILVLRDREPSNTARHSGQAAAGRSARAVAGMSENEFAARQKMVLPE